MLSSKLRLFAKRVSVLFFKKTCLHSNELTSRDYLRSFDYVSFDYFLNAFFFFPYNVYFFFPY